MNWVLMAVAGFAAGVAAAMGLGGGFVLLVALALTGTAQREAQWINLVFFLPVAALALILHRKNGLLDLGQVVPAAAGGLLGAVLGVWLSGMLGDVQLGRLFALFLGAVGIWELIGSWKKPKDEDPPPH